MNLTRNAKKFAVVLLAIFFANLLPVAGAQQADQPFTIAVIPDTQNYVQFAERMHFFEDQLSWVVDERDARNIVFVTHEGDASQNADSIAEWDRVDTTFEALDDIDMPYAIAPGNHDFDAAGNAPEYDARFGASRFSGQAWYGGRHWAEGNRSSYQTVSAGDHDLLFIHVRHLQDQYGPTNRVLWWVNRVLSAHPDHLTFITTHEFTTADGSVAIPGLRRIIKKHCTVAAVFSGHYSGAARGAFRDSCGRRVRHVLTNYQAFTDGGEGFLRTVEINPVTLRAKFEVYSPTLDIYRTGPDEAFTVSLTPL